MWVEIDKRFAELTGAAEGETYDKFVGGIALGRFGGRESNCGRDQAGHETCSSFSWTNIGIAHVPKA